MAIDDERIRRQVESMADVIEREFEKQLAICRAVKAVIPVKFEDRQKGFCELFCEVSKLDDEINDPDLEDWLLRLPHEEFEKYLEPFEIGLTKLWCYTNELKKRKKPAYLGIGDEVPYRCQCNGKLLERKKLIIFEEEPKATARKYRELEKEERG